VVDAFTNLSDDTFMQYEGVVFMKTKSDEFKANWMVMQGNEVYFYRK
jgi:hypothetical protein